MTLLHCPELCDYRLNFVNYFKGSNKFDNLEALSHCYANYKRLGVIYSSKIMKIIYEYDGDGITEVDDERQVEIEPPKEFYLPKNFYVAQDKVGFKFIKFVRSVGAIGHHSESVDPMHIELTKTDEKVTSTMTTNTMQNDVTVVPEPFEDTSCNDIVKRFKDMYIEMKFSDGISPPTSKLLNLVSTKTEIMTDFKYKYDNSLKKNCCEIILNKTVLIGKGCAHTKKKATNAALLDFDRLCLNKGKYKGNKTEKDSNIYPAEVSSTTDLADISLGAEIYELAFLDEIYIRNNRSNVALSVLKETFQFFKIPMQFKELDDKVNLIVNDCVLASMPFYKTLSKTQTRLSDFVLKHLEKSKWTLMRNTWSVNKSENFVDKEVMYKKNVADQTKIDSTLNVGGQLMFKMGWNEECGLGKSGAGIKDPVINDSNARRQGFGFNLGSSSDLKSFVNNVSKLIREWLCEDEDDIIFDRDFDNKERAVIHKECRRYGVTSKSYNNASGDRFLVMSRHREPRQLLEWVKSKGGKTRLYTLLAPGLTDLSI